MTTITHQSRPPRAWPSRERGWAIALATLVALAGCDSTGTAPPLPTIPSTDPMAVSTPPPDYPLAVACAGIGGTVTLGVTLGKDGWPGDVRPEVNSRQPLLDAAAVAAVRTWQFKPATTAGKPVTVRIRVPVKFTPPTIRPDQCFQFDEQQRSGR